MDSSQGRALPSWVRKRDGRTEPFDADKINRTLFAATETLGKADAFVARELTDGVLHFLPAEIEGNEVRSAQIEETLVKVVRELGQPRLAEAYAAYSRQRDRSLRQAVSSHEKQQHGPTQAELSAWLRAGVTPQELCRRAGATALATFSLEHVYSRNLVAACQEGLLWIGGLEHPQELTAAVCRPFALGPSLRGQGVFEAMQQARCYIGGTVVIDAPERDLAQMGGRISEAGWFVRELHWAATTLGLAAVLNLGGESGPSGFDEAAAGPLFAEQWKPESAERVLGFLEVLLDQVLSLPAPTPVRIDWHLTARDFTETEGRQRLLRLIRAALRGQAIRFACDRSRRPVTLGEGLDRNHPAALVVVGLDLPALLHRLGASIPLEQFAGKVQSLVRLAASAGVQKRDFIRRHGRHERPAFLLDRAHVTLRLRGIEETLNPLLGERPWERAETWTFLHALAQQLVEALHVEERHIHLMGLFDDSLTAPFQQPLGDATVGYLRHVGRLHTAFGRGTVLLPQPADAAPEPTGILELLHQVWKQTAVCRLGFTRVEQPVTQLTAGWKEV